MKKSRLTGHVAGYIWSISVIFLFSAVMGVCTISIGFGALFPPLNLLAKPFVCPSGQMDYEETRYDTAPGTTYTEIAWFCTDAHTGIKTALDFIPINIFSGAIFTLPIFAIVWPIAYRAYKRDGYWWFDKTKAYIEQVEALSDDVAPQHVSAHRHAPAPDEDAASRMDALQRLRERKMITDAEYEKKRAEILEDL